MRKIYLRNLFPLLIAGILMGSLSACSQSEELSQEENIVEDQKIAIQPEVLMDGIATRAGMELKDLTYFYLRIVNSQSAEFSYLVKMVKNAEGKWYASTDLKNNTTEPKLFFQNGKQSVTVQAIYWKNNTSLDNFITKYKDDWNNTLFVWMSSTFYNNITIKNNDPLFFSKVITPQTDAPGGVLPINFQHRFAKIHLRLEFDNYCTQLIGANQSSLSQVSFGGLLRGINKYMIWNLGSNTIDYTGDTRTGTTSLNYTQWDPGSMTTNISADYELMAVPQLVPSGAFNASFSIYDEIFTWTYQGQEFNLESNTEYDITLQVYGEDPTTKGTSNDTQLTKKNIKITGSIKEIKGGQQ